MDNTERFEVIRLAARYHETLTRIQTAGQLGAVLRLGRELSVALPPDQAALFGRLVAAREAVDRVPRPRNTRHDDHPGLAP